MNRLFIICLSVFSFIINASQPQIAFPSVKKNVAYSKVASLSFKDANQKIAYGNDPEQFALLWRIQTGENHQAKPLVILIHGGCWLSAYDIQHTYALSTGLAQAGFNVWSLEYRRSGKTGGGWPDTFEDIKAGVLASSRFNEAEFPLTNSVVVGHSAGGHLALLAGAEFDSLHAVIGMAAITDIAEYAMGTNSCQKVTKDFMQGLPEDKPTEYQAANPSKQVLHGNTILLQGDKDNIVPAFQLAQLQRKGVKLQGVGHFDWIHPGSQAFAELVKQLGQVAK